MMLELKNVGSYYGKTPILENINLSLPEGKCLCILGRNGVGKSTLLHTMMGLTTKMTGQIHIDGNEFSNEPTHNRAKAGLGYVPQGRRILGKFTIRENILLGSFASENKTKGIPDLCMELFPYLRDNLDAGSLSGGQQQQLAIARALATNPKVLLLDEPMEGIQPNVVQEIGEALKMLNRELGMTLVLTEQHIKVAKQLSDYFLMMDVGRVVAGGPINELTEDLVQTHLTI